MNIKSKILTVLVPIAMLLPVCASGQTSMSMTCSMMAGNFGKSHRVHRQPTSLLTSTSSARQRITPRLKIMCGTPFSYMPKIRTAIAALPESTSAQSRAHRGTSRLNQKTFPQSRNLISAKKPERPQIPQSEKTNNP